jgi:uncharacterized protein (TIGR02466 family)
MANFKFQNIFTVPLATCEWDDSGALHEVLLRRISAHQKSYRGDSRSNIGGWRSETGQLEFLGDAGREVIGRMQTLTVEATRAVFQQHGLAPPQMRWQLQAWVNVCDPGAFNSAHSHPGSTWSGVYYVDAGAPTSQHHSQLQLIAPEQGRASTFMPYLLPDTLCISPTAGMMVVFPSYLMHAVLPHQGERPRVSIALNLRSDPYP